MAKLLKIIHRVAHCGFIVLPGIAILTTVIVLILMYILYPLPSESLKNFQRLRLIGIGGCISCYLIWLVHFIYQVSTIPFTYSDVMEKAENNPIFRATFNKVLDIIREGKIKSIAEYEEQVLTVHLQENSWIHRFKLIAPFFHLICLILIGTLYSLTLVLTDHSRTDNNYEFILINNDDILIEQVGENHTIPINKIDSLRVFVRKEIMGAGPYTNLDPTSTILDPKGTFLNHIYFNTITVATIGFGRVSPVHKHARFGTTIQSLSVLIVLLHGIGYMLAHEHRSSDMLKEHVSTRLKTAWKGSKASGLKNRK